MKLGLFVLSFLTCSAHAQYRLSGTGYRQNFDTVETVFPSGWRLDTSATSSALGGAAPFMAVSGTSTRWSNAGGLFKNVASANSFTSFASATNAAQLTATDRALGIRQTGTFGDPGAAFVFQLEHTFRLSNFEIDYKLQSLDSSSGSRVTRWSLQYAIGENPVVFTTVDIDSTGGNTFSNKLKTVAFGKALDDLREPVWIRIIALHNSTGTGSRTTTAIDDVELRWTGIAEAAFRPLIRRTFPENAATDVNVEAILSIDFSRYVTIGSGDIHIQNETRHTSQTISMGSSFVSVVGKTLYLTGVRLEPACTYHVTLDSGIVDTSMATTYAITDTTDWRFSTVSSLPPVLMEYFDTICTGTRRLPSGWYTYDSEGEESWDCSEHATANVSYRMYGNDGLVNRDNTDWLISPRLDVSSPDLMGLGFHMQKRYTGDELQVLLSGDYAGSGNPDSASWLPAGVVMSAADTGKWMFYRVDLSAHLLPALHLGFKYRSGSIGAYEVRIDSVFSLTRTNVPGRIKDVAGEIMVLGKAYTKYLLLRIYSQSDCQGELRLYDIRGRLVFRSAVLLRAGTQQLPLYDVGANPGMHILELTDKEGRRMLNKCMIEE